MNNDFDRFASERKHSNLIIDLVPDVASGDVRGWLRVWAYDHPEHLPRLDVQVLAGPIRDIAWDGENPACDSAESGHGSCALLNARDRPSMVSTQARGSASS